MTASAKSIRFDDDSLWLPLDDGRTLSAPLAWFPRLLAATPEQRSQFELSPRGMHWEALDEDASIDGLLAGHGDLSHGRWVSVACASVVLANCQLQTKSPPGLGVQSLASAISI